MAGSRPPRLLLNRRSNYVLHSRQALMAARTATSLALVLERRCVYITATAVAVVDPQYGSKAENLSFQTGAS